MNTPQTNIDSFPFLFKKPENEPLLSSKGNIAVAMGALASRLITELRTRTIHPDGRRENVSEHAHMLARVAPYVAQQFYPWLDRGLVSIYSIIHDDPEAYVGDTPTDLIAGHDPEMKHYIESLAVEQLAAEYTDTLPRYVEDMRTYETQESDEAQFTRIMDKFMVILINIPNEGEVLRKNYTYELYVRSTYDTEKKLLEQYPQWIELIEVRTELALHFGNKYFRDHKGPVQDMLQFDQ